MQYIAERWTAAGEFTVTLREYQIYLPCPLSLYSLDLLLIYALMQNILYLTAVATRSNEESGILCFLPNMALSLSSSAFLFEVRFAFLCFMEHFSLMMHGIF